jgi:hypothetical protein
MFLRDELEPYTSPVKKPETPGPMSPATVLKPETPQVSSGPKKLVLRETHHLRPNTSFATEFEFPQRD